MNKKLIRKIRKQERQRFEEKLKELKMMPKGWNPLPYIFWYLKIEFKKSLILLIIIAIIGLLYSSRLILRTKFMKVEKPKIKLEKILLKDKQK